MKRLSLLIKPASSLCNLRCGYCFYHSLAEQRSRESYGIMEPHTADTLIGRALDEACDVTFIFQGGEPTLAGLDFFRHFTAEAEQRKASGMQVSYAMQTNGVDMTEEFARFLGEHQFLVGLSLDGPEELNDWMRGSGSFRSAMGAAALFERMGVQYNILSVVHAGVARHAAKVYRFLTGKGFRYLQFIPCLDPLGSKPFSQRHSLKPELYSDFLIRLFHLWADDVIAGRGVSIRFFDNLLAAAAGYPPEQCGMQGRCGGQLVVEADGSMYPCDFYCVDDWRIGSIADMSIRQAFESPAMRRFIETSAYDDAECLQCQYYGLCRGGCRRDRDAQANGAAGPNRYCGALKRFYAEAAPRLPELLRAVSKNPVL